MNIATKREVFASVIILAAVYAVLFATAPTLGGFWDSESARNPLNGAFIMDFLTAMPFSDPVGWAYDYYYQYPALTVLFYPPGLYFFLALVYLVFGVSHAAAVGTVILFGLAMSIGLFLLARRVVSFPSAIGFAAVVALVPAVALGARHVMLEIPAQAFFVWAGVFILYYLDTAKAKYLFAALFFALATVYTKQTVFYLVFILAVLLIRKWGFRILVDKNMLVAAVLGLLGIVPLVLMQLKFGTFNLTSLVQREDVAIERFSLEGIFYYIDLFPTELGWTVTILLAVSLLGLIVLYFRKRQLPEGVDTYLFFALWALLGYVFLVLVSLKAPRHGIPIYIPAIFPIFVFLDQVLRSHVRIIAQTALIALVGWESLTFFPVPEVNGYRDAALSVSKLVGKNGRVAFSGNRDGSFIFNMRTIEDRRDIVVARVDKLLLNVNIMPQLGLNGNDFSKSEISNMLDRYGIQYIVAVPNLWIEEPVMAEFQKVLDSPQFELVQTIPVVANVGTSDKELRIYKNTHPLPEKPENYSIKVNALGGKVGKK